MSNDAGVKIDALLLDLWQRHLPKLHERLGLLDRIAAEASTGNLTEPARLEALDIAHKLAGNLGMFGHHQASRIASNIEHILKSPAPETLASLNKLVQNLRNTLGSSL